VPGQTDLHDPARKEYTVSEYASSLPEISVPIPATQKHRHIIVPEEAERVKFLGVTVTADAPRDNHTNNHVTKGHSWPGPGPMKKKPELICAGNLLQRQGA